jgi:hypothetical protein
MSVELYSRYIAIKDGGESSLRRTQCICSADQIIFESRCPRSACGIFQKVISNPTEKCWEHGIRTLQLCGGNVEMCDQCTQDGYTAYNGRGDGLMTVRNEKIEFYEEYYPVYIRHPNVEPEPLF